MLSVELAKELSNQVNAEYYSAYLYLVMSAFATRLGLKGTAHWLFVQAQEELAHGTHIYEYIIERGSSPSFTDIAQPPKTFDGVYGLFEMVLDHEQKITKSINAIATQALQESDHACYQFVMWFANEQVEEEANVNDILDKLRLIRENRGDLLTFDNELATRVFVNPFPANG